MPGTREQYYTPVEFAKLFNIDKQTLIYYDNQGIFAPAFKNENGYRYYSVAQIAPFSILLSLRKLNIQGYLLAEYNKNPSVEKLTEMLKDKIFEYNETVTSLSNQIKYLRDKISDIQRLQDLPVNKIMLIPHNRIYCQRSIVIPKNTSYKRAFLACAPLISQFAGNLLTHDIRLSFMPIFKKTEELAEPHEYRIVLLTNDQYLFNNPLTYEPALYLTVIMEDGSRQNIRRYITMLTDFMNKVKLSPDPLAFITPLQTFNYTGNAENRLTKIELKVHYA